MIAIMNTINRQLLKNFHRKINDNLSNFFFKKFINNKVIKNLTI